MTFIATPIEMISAPNFFSELKDNRWMVTDPNAQTLWFQLEIIDNLGQRRYIPAGGSTMSVVFQRADEFSTDNSTRGRLQNQVRTVTKAATANVSDASLFSISLTTADITGIVSGTVKFTLTEAAVPTTWVQNFFIRKSLTAPGF
jgi:hypothetical protein